MSIRDAIFRAPWRATTRDVLHAYESSSERGLASREARDRRKRYGDNVVTEKGGRSLFRVYLAQMLNPLMLLLLTASVVTWYVAEYAEAVSILLVVIVNAGISTYQEYTAEKTIASLRTYMTHTGTVVRDGEHERISSEHIVPGDVMVVRNGEKVLADGRIIESNECSSDESLVTGESLPREKHAHVIHTDVLSERANMLFAGMHVVTGTARMVVTRTGDATELGRIAASVISAHKTTTPVHQAVASASRYIFVIACVLVVLICALGVFRGEDVFSMIVLSVAVAVGAVPEALPIALSVILAIGVLKIARAGGLVNKLDAAETLGSTTLVLTDKTGTLTTGELVFTGALLPNGEVAHGIHVAQMLERVYPALEARVERGEAREVYAGNPFEVALLRAIHERRIPTEHIPRGESLKQFSSVHKYSAWCVEGKTVFVGAPETMIEHATLSAQQKQTLLARVEEYSMRGVRLVSLAEKDGRHDAPHGVHIHGICMVSDTVRSDVAEAVRSIRAHGVDVKVISGDLPGTVRAIAETVGIADPHDELLTGSDISSMDDDTLKERLPHVRLFARVTPEDKQRIGRLYQQLGHVVAMTGDGVNDAPALKAMDIGVALGSGTDVAKSAADIILLKNSFTTISETILSGRVIKSNIRKVFVYLMSNSLDAVCVIAGALIAGLALPLSALHILWVNLVTGTLPALAFAYDARMPYRERPNEPIFNHATRILAFGIGTVTSMLLFGLYWVLVATIPEFAVAQSLFFVCFSVYVLSGSYSFVRLEKVIGTYNPFSNWRLNAANALGLCLIYVSVWTPIGRDVLSLHEVPVSLVWVVVLWCAVNMFILEAAKYALHTAMKPHGGTAL